MLGEVGSTRERRLASAISSREGAEVFDRVLRHRFPHLVVSPQPLAEILAASRDWRLSGLVADRDCRRPRDARGARSVAAGRRPRRPLRDFERGIVEIWRDLLRVGEVGTDDDFFTLGGDSLIALGLAAKIRDRFQVDVPLKQLLERPTVAAMAEAIAAGAAAGRAVSV